MLNGKGQVAVEFIVVYSIMILIFILLFYVITTQRAQQLNQEDYSVLQLQAQNIVSYIDEAQGAANGFSVSIPINIAALSTPYNISISTTGVVELSMSIANQIVSAYAFSSARDVAINGTLEYEANGIAVYQVPSYSATINVTQYDGIIYIDQKPITNLGLTKSVVAQGIQGGYAAYFNGVSSNILIPSSTPLELANSVKSYTISAWLKLNSETSKMDVINYGLAGQYGYVIGIGGISPCGGTQVKVTKWGVADICIGSYPQDTKWHFITLEYNSIGTFLYIDGVLNGQSSNNAGIKGGISPLLFGTGSDVPGNAGNFNGIIANVQIYNTSLTQNQIRTLYNEGIFGSPVQSNSIVGWWPLDGNSYDYSGNANYAQYSNVIFSTVASAGIYASKIGGGPQPNDLIGAIISNNNANSNSIVSTFYTNTSGTSTLIPIYNTIEPNLDIYAFNGNLSTQNALVAWWPMYYGTNLQSNAVYDISGNGNEGIFSQKLLSPQSNQTNFMALNFPGDNPTIPNNALYDGYIKIPNAGTMLNINGNNQTTLVLWAKYNGGNPNHCEGLFGSGGVNSIFTGFQLMGYGNGGECQFAYLNGNTISWASSSNSLPVGRWVMLTFEMASNAQKNTFGYASIYLNNTLYPQSMVNKVQSIAPGNNIYVIGNDAWSQNGLDTFNGVISNVQLYGSILSQSQIASLYSQGPISTPLPNMGIIGWWPLDGSPKDYSGNSNNGNIEYNVSGINQAYDYNSSTGPYISTFNGINGVNVYSENNLLINGPYSIGMWFSTSRGPDVPFYSDLLSTQNPHSLNTYYLAICTKGPPTCSNGIDSYIGDSAALITYLNYTMQFSANTMYNVVESVGDNGVQMYINGINESYKTYSSTPSLLGVSSPYDYISIGTGISPSTPFEGQIENVQIYNSIITPTQARQIYEQGVSSHYSLNLPGG